MKLIHNVGVAALLLSAVSVFLVAGPARCATYNVTSLADDGGPGQLRAAISAANANAGSTITFQSGLSGTITLSPTLQALPTILVNTTIQGPGRSLIAVDGRGTYRPFEINAPGASVGLSGLTIQNGADAGGTGGGGILLDAGDLTLRDCTLSGNIATGNGGGLLNYGTATITNCTFSNNHGYNGGGIYNYTYSGSGGLATLTDCTLTGNSATINGGGVYNYTYSGTGGSSTLTRTHPLREQRGRQRGRPLQLQLLRQRRECRSDKLRRHEKHRGLRRRPLRLHVNRQRRHRHPDGLHGRGQQRHLHRRHLRLHLLRQRRHGHPHGLHSLRGRRRGTLRVRRSPSTVTSRAAYAGAGNVNADPLFVSPATRPAPAARLPLPRGGDERGHSRHRLRRHDAAQPAQHRRL